jgi:hypothetical protein
MNNHKPAMTKGYQIIEPTKLIGIFNNSGHDDLAVAVFYWLIQQLKIELKDQLVGVQIEVIKVAHHYAWNVYPTLGIHYESELPQDLEPLIEKTIDLLLEEWPIIDLLTFIAASKTDWKAVTKELMDKGSIT